MSYTSTMEQNVKVYLDRIKPMRYVVEKSEKLTAVTSDYLTWHIGLMVVKDSGELEWGGGEGVWYASDGLAVFIAKYAKEGQMVFTGEDGERWGYWFDGDRHVYKLEFPDPVRTREEVSNESHTGME